MLVRMEQTLRVHGARIADGNGYAVFACAKDSSEEVAELLRNHDDVDICEILEEAPCFMVLWLVRSYDWGSLDQVGRDVFSDVTNALEGFDARVHLSFISQAGCYCCFEVMGTDALQAAQSVSQQVCHVRFQSLCQRCPPKRRHSR
jgi:hypothetical protein